MREKLLLRRKKAQIIFIILFVIGFLSLFFFKTTFTISQITSEEGDKAPYSPSENLPKLPSDNPDRLDILLLGIRGGENTEEGNYLSDTLMIVSVEKKTGKVALISIPRDLYIQPWGLREKKKINFAYAYGGLECAKKTVSMVTGLYIDYAVSIDFEGFKEVVDILGGIDIYLEKPFEEIFQWSKEGKEESEYWVIKEFPLENQSVEKTSTSSQETSTPKVARWVFYIPAGQHHLNGEEALYYARSRYSTNDFDRMRRQQKILLALKEKILSLGVLANPVKIYNLLDALGQNIRTDISWKEIKNFISLASNIDAKHIKRLVFDTSEEGLLYQTFINNEYVLLPVGNNFVKIQEACQNIFNYE